ncbi:MAG: PEP/pyruvate-binding domain-containing protein [Anaerolineae bacterium]
MGRYIVGLDSRRALREECTGGKAAGLAWLTRNGLNVPRGFVITSAAFRDFVASCKIQMPGQRQDWTREVMEPIRQRLIAAEVPGPLARSIVDAYLRLGGSVAVRSSMFGEDGRTSSFAGQLDTVLDVSREKDVLDAVRRCWASAFNWRNVKYLKDRGEASATGALLSLSVAVIVQRMVDAKAAGVAFSADPLTGQRCVIVEAIRGLGDSLVGGQAQPDRYIVDARGALAEVTLVGREPTLRDRDVLCLAEKVRAIARRLGTPQDVEWAWDGVDFHILQSRPITSLMGKTVYSNEMVSDMAPGLITPLVYSTKIIAMTENVFGRLFTELLGPSETDYKLLVARIRSRIYTSVTLLGALFDQLGMPPNFFEAMSRGELAGTRRPRLTPATVRAMFRLASFVRRHSRIALEIRAFVERHDRQLERYRHKDWSDKDPRDLLAAFDQLMSLHGELQWYVFIGPINMAVRNRLLSRLVETHAEDVAPSDLIRGLVGLKALEPNEDLRKLAIQVRSLGPDVERSLITGEDRTVRQMLSGSQMGKELLEGVDAFLNRHGFLSPNGTDFAATPWIERPTLIWRAIGRYASHPPPRVTEDTERRREVARERVRSQLAGLRRLVFDRLLASTTTYIDLRERTSLLMSEDSYQMRRIFLALADHFVARGDLGRSDDIFYLFYPEVQQLVEGELGGRAVMRLVASRRAEMAADAEVELPDTICGDRFASRPIRPASSQEYLVGISGSAGVAQGYARIIFDPAEMPDSLTQEDIVVVPFTDVGWTPLFPGIGGIVAETGGQLSHTSIVAREYGLPAVVSVKQATRLLAEGQPITVDGDTGRVYLRHLAD